MWPILAGGWTVLFRPTSSQPSTIIVSPLDNNGLANSKEEQTNNHFVLSFPGPRLDNSYTFNGPGGPVVLRQVVVSEQVDPVFFCIF